MATEYYLGDNRPEEAMKTSTIIYYGGKDGERAIQLAQAERSNKRNAMLRDSLVFWGEEEACSQIWIMPTVPPHKRKLLIEVYGSRAVELTAEDVDNPSVISKPQTSAQPESATPDYRSMTNKELRAMAVARGLDAQRAYTKDDLVKVLETGSRAA